MSNFIGYILCGVVNLLILRKLIYVVNLNDKDIILPEKIQKKEYFFMFLCGGVSFHGFCMDTIIFLILSVYLSFMSYTDYHTRKVYSAFSYFIFLIGIFCFITKTQNWMVNIEWLIIYFTIIDF